MSNGRIGPKILAATGLDPQLVLMVPHPEKQEVGVLFALDEVVLPSHNDVIGYWRDRANNAEKFGFKGENLQAHWDAQAADPQPEQGAAAGGVPGQRTATEARAAGMDRAGEVDSQREQARNYIGDGADRKFSHNRVDGSPVEGADRRDYTGTFGAEHVADALEGVIIVNGTPFDTIRSVISKAAVSLSNGLEIHVGAVGFNQIAIVQKEGTRPFVSMPPGRYIYFPEG